MAVNSTLIPVKAEGWSSGLANLMQREMADWWKTRRWLTTGLMWLLILNGLLALVLSAPAEATASSQGTPLDMAASLFCIFSGVFLPIGVMVGTQGAIVGEKQNGTAAWILSKPVSRIAFILSKFLANTLAYLVLMILLQGLVAFGVMIAFGLAPQPGPFVAGMALLYLNLLFFQCFTLMMGTFVSSRRTVIGVSLLLVFVLNQFAQMSFGKFLPGHLPYDAAELMAGRPFAGSASLGITFVLTIVFLALAFWRFNREEF
jgi:ABC-2 type transport system permease protein